MVFLSTLGFDRFSDNNAQPGERDFASRQGLCCADEADRHKRCARHECNACGTAVPDAVSADGALGEDRDRLSFIERVPYLRERTLVAAATLNPDRAESIECPGEQSRSPEFRLRDETQFTRQRRPQDDSIDHRVVIRSDNCGPGDGKAIGADHLESIYGAYQIAEESANLFIGRSGERQEGLIVVCPT